jgi:hypothetical protein
MGGIQCSDLLRYPAISNVRGAAAATIVEKIASIIHERMIVV